MTNRRRLLLSYLANSFKYLPYSYEYLYYGLVPNTIDSKQVRNKAKVSKLYGNSVVENQLFQYGNFADSSKWTADYGSVSISNGIATYTISSLSSDNCRIRNFGSTNKNQLYIQGHSYLISAKIINPSRNMKFNFQCTGGLSNYIYLNDQEVSANTTKIISAIFTATSTSVVGTSNNFAIGTGTTHTSNLAVGDSFSVEYVELIYITKRHPFNAPTTLTDNRVQAILNRGYIPFNLGELKSVDIGEISTTKADTSALQTIPFKYQGSGVGTAHDTYELTKTSHVFTKKQAYTDLNKLTFSKYTSGSNWLFYANVSGGRSGLGANVSSNMLCDKYMTNPLTQGGTATASGDDKTATWDANNSQILIKDTSYVDVSDFQSGVSGTLEYQLATPQVITIPRKHLGIKRIRDLSWEKYSSSNNYYAQATDKAFGQTNMYCSQFLTTNNASASGQNMNDLEIGGSSANRYFYIKVLSASTTTDFLNKYGDYLIFYETENEVSDITDTFDIQSGGTINTDSNVLPNADFLMKCK